MFKARNYILPTGEKALVMAVINLTPDSFYEGSRFDFSNATAAAELAVKQGADIIDIGAQSTAPDSTPITAEEELQRLIQPLKAIRKVVDIPISVDTFFPSVAKAALQNGADIINDVSGKADPEMLSLAAEYGAGYIAMHTGGSTSKEPVTYKNGVIADINLFFKKVMACAESAGINRSNICLDPGIGFGKAREDDLEIISNFSSLNSHGCTMLAALSRKRVARLCGDALTGTVIYNTLCILGGAGIIRVHDVPQAVATAQAAKLIKGGKN